MLKHKNFHYIDMANNGVIRIRAKRRPSPQTIPRSGTWILHEFNNGWELPCVAEVMWGTLKKLHYLGYVEDAEVKG